jgi:hypothetical protein
LINKLKVLKNIPILGTILTKIYGIIRNYSIESFYHYNAKFNRTMGVTVTKRSTPIIVTLTTIPERIDRVYLAIETLLKQSLKPDRLILWVKKSDFSLERLSNKNQFTKQLIRQKLRGLQIEFCEDLYSYSKIIHTLEKYPNAIIVSADDDLYYKKHWLKELYESYLSNPECVHCHMARYIIKSSKDSLKTLTKWDKSKDKLMNPSFNNFPYSGAGCLFPPNSLHSEVFNKRIFLKISPHCDDAWFKAMTILNNVKSKQVKPISSPLRIIPGTTLKTLVSINLGKGQFDGQVRKIFTKYDLFKYLD